MNQKLIEFIEKHSRDYPLQPRQSWTNKPQRIIFVEAVGLLDPLIKTDAEIEKLARYDKIEEAMRKYDISMIWSEIHRIIHSEQINQLNEVQDGRK
jgi:hypothetical protein